LISILFGGLLATTPVPGMIGLMWALGIYGLVFGAMEVALSFRLRRAGDVRPAEEAPPKAA
jgi:uncharacterized membrane protein HdeD (DUF308 family)